MRLRHLEAIAPVCPVCRNAPVQLAQVARGDDADVVEGILACTDAACATEFPVIDGIPILVADLATAVGDQILGILGRTDLSESLLGLLGECCGPSSTFNSDRDYLSTYCWGHYADLDPQEQRTGERPATIVPLLDRGLARLAEAGRKPEVAVADIGCSVGRSTFHLAARTAGVAGAGPLVLGLDWSFPMLRVARRVLTERRVRYARRRTGLVYDDRTFDVPVIGADRIDFWCADALALPFYAETFDLATSVNLFDCLSTPVDHLRSLSDLVRPGGSILLATPFDWSDGATSPEHWVGGRLPRAAARGDCAAAVRDLLGSESLPDLALIDEIDNLEWNVRSHGRSVTRYQVDLFVIGR